MLLLIFNFKVWSEFFANYGGRCSTIPTEFSNDEPILTLENLSIGYSKPLVESVNLKIYQGDRIAIIGSSGIGKTTLLRTISGLIAPLSGEIKNHHNG